MTTAERPAVPPLTDAAVSRIERGVLTALDRDGAQRTAPAISAVVPRRRWSAVVVTATVLAAMVVLGVRELRHVSRSPSHGARIATAASPSHVTVEGAAIDVAPSSAIDVVDERDGATVIRLERGSVTCEVAPRGTRAPFVVEAGTTRVTVIGTRFSVTRVGDHARVWVAHGTVEVGDDGATQLVHAGERYLPGVGPNLVAVLGEPEAAAAVAPIEPTPTSLTAAHTSAPVILAVASTERTPAAERVSPVPSLHRRVVSPTRIALRAPHEGHAEAAPPEPSPAVDAPVTPVAARAVDPPPPTVPAAATSGVALRVRFETAAGLEVSDPSAAFRIYRQLASGAGPWAANALFAQARLSAEWGQRDAARALSEAYLERFPHGPNAGDARVLLDRMILDR